MPDPLIIYITAGFFLITLALIFLLFIKSRGSSETNSLGELKGRLHELEQISRTIEELRTLFIMPRTRGDLGETILAELLKNWLPDENYTLQYSFSSGTRVDAVIHLGQYMVGIDAKFPLQSVKEALIPKDNEETPGEIPGQVKRTFLHHARDIAGKYIRPDEGTLQFALMYIPSESLYYRCFVEDSQLSARILEQKVVPTSPSTLFLYIQTVAYGLRGFRFSQKAEQMVSHLSELQTELRTFDRNMGTASTHLKNLIHSFDNLSQSHRRIDTLMKRLEKDD